MPAQFSRSNRSNAVERRFTPGAGRGWPALAIAGGHIALVWLVLLPAVGRWSPVETWIDRNQAAGIDPSVKFYSELPVMRSIQWHMERLRRRAPEVFWDVRGGPPSAPKNLE